MVKKILVVGKLNPLEEERLKVLLESGLVEVNYASLEDLEDKIKSHDAIMRFNDTFTNDELLKARGIPSDRHATDLLHNHIFENSKSYTIEDLKVREELLYRGYGDDPYTKTHSLPANRIPSVGGYSSPSPSKRKSLRKKRKKKKK